MLKNAWRRRRSNTKRRSWKILQYYGYSMWSLLSFRFLRCAIFPIIICLCIYIYIFNAQPAYPATKAFQYPIHHRYTTGMTHFDWQTPILSKYQSKIIPILIYNTPFWGSNLDEFWNCRIPCELTSDTSRLKEASLVLLRFPMEITTNIPRWHGPLVGFTMEPESMYPMYSAQKLTKKYGASQHYSFDSTFPYTYFDYYTYDGIRKNSMHLVRPWGKRIKKGVFIARDCNSTSGREEIVQKLFAKGLVDSVSDCMRNKEWPGGSKVDVMNQYMFYFAFENSIVKDLVTEKAYEALSSGNIPVYFGAPNAKDGFFPHKNALIFYNDYKSIDKLVDHLQVLMNDKSEWMKYHDWRLYDSQWDKRFYERMMWTKYHKDCRLCEYAWSKKIGVGWDKKKQDIVYPRGSVLE